VVGDAVLCVVILVAILPAAWSVSQIALDFLVQATLPLVLTFSILRHWPPSKWLILILLPVQCTCTKLGLSLLFKILFWLLAVF
jgi:hypothetical protein